jgi:hypothetical protein
MLPPTRRAYNGEGLAAAILAALLFAVLFVAATYYPHNISLPTLTSRDVPKARPLPTPIPQSGDAAGGSASRADITATSMIFLPAARSL